MVHPRRGFRGIPVSLRVVFVRFATRHHRDEARRGGHSRHRPVRHRPVHCVRVRRGRAVRASAERPVRCAVLLVRLPRQRDRRQPIRVLLLERDAAAVAPRNAGRGANLAGVSARCRRHCRRRNPGDRNWSVPQLVVSVHRLDRVRAGRVCGVVRAVPHRCRSRHHLGRTSLTRGLRDRVPQRRTRRNLLPLRRLLRGRERDRSARTPRRHRWFEVPVLRVAGWA